MSSAHPSDGPTPDAGIDPAAAAATLRDAGFVRLVALADGDALAAAGLLATALRAAGVPFQTRVRTVGGSPDTGADDTVVAVGGRASIGGDADVHLANGDVPTAVAAHAVARELGEEPSPVPALAGAVAAGTTPGADGTAPLLEEARRRGAVERRPGLAVPVADLADGLAHSTLVRAPFSGDFERAADLIATDGEGEPTAEERRRIASLVAVTTATAPDAPPRAASAVERLLRPYATPSGPFATLGGGADVLSAVARERPGTGVALVLGGDGRYDPRPAALEAWRTHGRAVHGLLGDATTGRYDGLFVVRTEGASAGRLWTAARLVRAFRSPEPVALVVGDGAAAATAATAPTDAMSEAVDRIGDGRVVANSRTAVGRFDGEVQAFIAAFREAAA